MVGDGSAGSLPPYEIIQKLYAAFGLDVMAADAVSRLLAPSSSSSSPAMGVSLGLTAATDSGSDAFGGMRTTVRRSGDEYLLNGRKTFITNGPYADTVVVYAKSRRLWGREIGRFQWPSCSCSGATGTWPSTGWSSSRGTRSR